MMHIPSFVQYWLLGGELCDELAQRYLIISENGGSNSDCYADYSAGGAITDHLPNHGIPACLKWSQMIKFGYCK